MPAANVRTYEKAMVPRVGGETGVYNAIVIPAKKGPINVPVLVTGENDLLNRFTPDGTIKVGYNIAYYSALTVLQQTNSLWTIRVANGALYGGAFVNQAGTTGVTYMNVNETSPEVPEIKFSVTNIVDGSNEVMVADLVGGTPADLNGRTINILGAGQITYGVTAVNGATLTLDAAIVADVSFVGSGTGTVAANDYISFDADYGIGGLSANVEATNLVSMDGLPVTTADLVGRVITFVHDSTFTFTRNVSSAVGSTLTLDSASPSVTSQTGMGYRGTPEMTATVSDIAEGSETATLSNILPVHVAIEAFNAKTIEIEADMTDASVLVISSTVSGASGAEITLDAGVNNPSLIDSSTGEAPYAEATADGFLDPSANEQPEGDLVNFDPASFYSVMQLFAINEGDWSKDVRVEILTEGVKNPDTFTINVYTKNNTVRPEETFVCSRDSEARDGFGRNIFVDVALQASNYINAKSNEVIDKAVLPRETVTRDIEGNITSRNFIKFVGGDDGDAVTSSNMIAAAELMDNKNNYPLAVFLDGGWAAADYQRKLVQICEDRDDSFAVLSIPYEVEMNPVTYVQDIVEYRRDTLNVNSSFGGIYSSHVKITDKYNNREIFIAPDGFAAAAINLSASNYEIWYPPAGFARGRMYVNDVHIKFTDGDLDYLADVGVNQIRFAPGKGVAIWGQLTLALIPNAFDRINIRLLLNYIKPAISAYLEHYLFELNTEAVRAAIKTTIHSYLSGIHARDGISAYDCICDNTNNSNEDEVNNTLNVDVYIKPVYSIEFINFTTVINNNAVSFTA